MVEVSFSPELEQLQGVVREFARERLAPRAAAAEAGRAVPEDVLTSLDRIGVVSSFDAGPDALDPLAIAVVAEEIAAGDPGVAYEIISGAHAARALAVLGTAEQAGSVAGLASPGATPLGSVWLYEGFGRNPHEYASALEQGADGTVLHGRKIGVVRPGTADFAVVFVRSAGEQRAVVLGPEQLAACAITRDDRVAGKLGLLSAHTGDVELRGVAVPADSCLTGGGDPGADRVIAAIRLSTAAIAVGAGTAALRYATRYSTEREAFGKTISSYQGVLFPLSEAEIALDAARYAIWDLASRLDAADDPARLAEQTAYVVAAANQAARSATVTGVNTLGGHGFLADHPVERWYRAAGTIAALDHDPLLD
jgi:alkylation response protein AidB-like acyl-CoA dehydrogenase